MKDKQMDIRFEDMKAQDLPSVKTIYDWYIENSTATFHTEPIGIDQLREFIHINHPLYLSYLIYLHEEVVGYCYLTHYKKRQAYNRTAEITIYLKPGYRRKGIGSIALNLLEKKAKEKGLKNLIGIITGENADSIALFVRCGYMKCAHFKNVGEKFNRILDVVAYQKEI
jgi:phosphinothricin acetyltransferase